VALVVQGDEVHVVGEKGAVEPGGATIRVTNLVSDKRASGRAARNGSFDVKAPGGVNDGFSVRASNADGSSTPVFVTQGSAAVPDGDGGMLSCEQQTRLAGEQLSAALDAADDTCAQASDCRRLSTGTLCTDSCSSGLVSKAGMNEVEAVMSAVNHGLCAGFKDQGCKVVASGCVPQPGAVACMEGHCAYDTTAAGIDAAAARTALCTDLYGEATTRLKQAAADADKRCSADDDCTLVWWSTCGNTSCGTQPASKTGESQFQTSTADVCVEYTENDCPSGGGPSCGAPDSPVCRGGTCKFSCGDRQQAAMEALQVATNAADRSCSVDDDCVIAPSSTDCSVGCDGDVVSVAGRKQVQDAIGKINTGEYCADFAADGCGLPDVDCSAPPKPAYKQGQCEAAP
jgi:hypothetical protein